MHAQLIREPMSHSAKSQVTAIALDSFEHRYQVNFSDLFAQQKTDLRHRVALEYLTLQAFQGYPEKINSPCDLVRCTHLIVAENEPGQIAGFIFFTESTTNSSVCEIDFTAVKDDCRRRGVLSEMLRVLALGYESIHLDCSAENETIFSRFGFVPTGTRQKHKLMERGPNRPFIAPKTAWQEITSVLLQATDPKAALATINETRA